MNVLDTDKAETPDILQCKIFVAYKQLSFESFGLDDALNHCRIAVTSSYFLLAGNPDYVAIPSIPFFDEMSSESSQRECVIISISNDTLLEDTESFNVMLSSSDSAVHISQGASTVYILDDDQVRLGLKEGTVTVSEDSQFIPVCVELVGRTQEVIEVVVETQPGSAQGEIA